MYTARSVRFFSSIAPRQRPSLVSVRASPMMYASSRRCTTKASDSPAGNPETLQDYLQMNILARGPLSVAEFMRHALSHPTLGYYTTKTVFGRTGDFVTSPEISQMFGELLAVWYVLMWERCGQPKEFTLLELGPGKGTLLADILRASKRFPGFYSALTSIQMVEISAKLINEQRVTLGCPTGEVSVDPETDTVMDKLPDGKPISWHSRFSDAMSSSQGESRPLFVLAHELFDALPVHQFQYSKTRKKWSELLVDVTSPAPASSTPPVASSPASTDSSPSPSPVLARECAGSGLRLVLAPSATPAMAASAKLLISLSSKEPLPNDGDIVEFSPASSALVFEIGAAIGRRGGAGLVIDYGRLGPYGASVRGIQAHKFVDFLESPGEVDLSADVDFAALAAAVNQTGIAEAQGPVTQGSFLSNLGIADRLEQLTNNLPPGNEELADLLLSEAYRLVAPEEMGSLYKVMAITPKILTHSRSDTVPGFEGIDSVTTNTAGDLETPT